MPLANRAAARAGHGAKRVRAIEADGRRMPDPSQGYPAGRFAGLGKPA